MPSIGILGANGQVGKEVCLLLNSRSDVSVIPICRSELSAAFLEACGLDCRIGKIDVADKAENLLKDIDLLADFSLPRGSQSEIRRQLGSILTNAITLSPPTGRFVYISSLMAMGTRDPQYGFSRRLLAKTAYGASKRVGERIARRTTRRVGRELYILRLGQVHGAFQGVSLGIAQQLASYRSVSVPGVPSYVVFCLTIADVLVNIAQGKERPGTYSLVENPPWTWKEVYDLYRRQTGSNCVVKEFAPMPRLRALNRAWHFLYGFIHRNRDVGSWYLGKFPRLERELRAQHYVDIAQAEIAELLEQTNHRPFNVRNPCVGGRRLRGVNGDRERIPPSMAIAINSAPIAEMF
ncbi:MAG: NAD(P)-dependent oxidoreductase [Deltaproteobacteria bacterium]|nr:NAD(P)-dependent oxidoreductase [Deltaproteobacteria bacterium]